MGQDTLNNVVTAIQQAQTDAMVVGGAVLGVLAVMFAYRKIVGIANKS